ncbi:hypothetical protein AA313_de0205951 [Arthrobotrys entomopaga]|nr:hypothetical protein AA313_de0205951 [Arthrobotrys entomopaga]
MSPIKRITLFKCPDEAHQNTILEAYTKLMTEAQKDGKPYIISLVAKKTMDDPRRKGYTLCATSIFKNLEDMNYYDTDCAAHKALKAVAAGKLEEMPTTVFMDADD